MEHSFGSLTSEWVSKLGYEDLDDAIDDFRDYIHDYYNVDKPHSYNDGVPRTKAEVRFQLELNEF